VVPTYLPALQLVHAELPFTSLYLPAAHNEHVPKSGPVNPCLQTQLLFPDDALNHSVLSGQGKQYVLLMAPSVTEYVLMGQFSHAPALVAPVVERNFPAWQFVHEETPKLSEYVPALQFTHTFCPTDEYFPFSQSTHAIDPVLDLNFPAIHAVHG